MQPGATGPGSVSPDGSVSLSGEESIPGDPTGVLTKDVGVYGSGYLHPNCRHKDAERGRDCP